MRLMTADYLREWAARNGLEIDWIRTIKCCMDTRVALLSAKDGTAIVESYEYPDTRTGKGWAMRDLRRRVNAMLEASE